MFSRCRGHLRGHQTSSQVPGSHRRGSDHAGSGRDVGRRVRHCHHYRPVSGWSSCPPFERTRSSREQRHHHRIRALRLERTEDRSGCRQGRTSDKGHQAPRPSHQGDLQQHQPQDRSRGSIEELSVPRHRRRTGCALRLGIQVPGILQDHLHLHPAGGCGAASSRRE